MHCWVEQMALQKQLLVSIVLVLSGIAVQAQKEKYVKHNLLVDRASNAAARGDLVLAEALYDSAVKVIPWDPAVYFDATLIALRAGQPTNANEFLCRGVENGFDPALFFDSLYSAFLGSEAAQPFRSKQSELQERFAEHADSVTIRKLKSMHERDQAHRDGGPLQERSDSLNFEEFIALCDAKGFPNARSVGHSMGIPWLLLWHHRDTYPESRSWRRVLPHIHSAIDAGDLDPSFLCMFDDMSDKEAGRPMRYGALLSYYQRTPADVLLVDPVRLQQSRDSVGWGPIEDFARQVGLDPSKIRYAAP